MTTAIDLAPDIEQRLERLVARSGRNKASYLQEIIEQGITDMENYDLAAEVLERVRNGQEQVFSADDVRHQLGLDD